MRAFRRRLRLPLRHNGAGLVGVDSIAAAAFAGSVIASYAGITKKPYPIYTDSKPFIVLSVYV
jgi:hypothetical protein